MGLPAERSRPMQESAAGGTHHAARADYDLSEGHYRMIVYHDVETPIGRLWLAASEQGLCRIEFARPEEAFLAGLHRDFSEGCVRDRAGIEFARVQVEEYLAGRRRAFDVPLDLTGTPPFHRATLAVCREIPYGETCTYTDLATALGRPGGARAVGNAMARNPIPLIYPCHRVLRTDGSLGGFRGGLPMKEWLLHMEAGYSQPALDGITSAMAATPGQ